MKRVHIIKASIKSQKDMIHAINLLQDALNTYGDKVIDTKQSTYATDGLGRPEYIIYTIIFEEDTE